MEFTREEWNALTPNEQWEMYRLTQIEADDLNRLVDMLPCPVHGRCVPYALNRIQGLLMWEP